MIAEPDAEVRRRSAVRRDQGRMARAVVGVPGPAQIGDPQSIRPGHVRIDVSVLAVVLAHLAGQDRHPLGDRRDGGVEARGRGALAEGGAVHVERGGQLVQWVIRLVLQPLAEVGGPADAAHHDRLGSASIAHRVHHALHPGGLPATRGGAAVEPAAPRNVMRFVVQVEDHRRVVLEGAGDR